MNVQMIKKLAVPVLKKHGVVRAGVFGSAASGEMNDQSDIDLLVQLPDTAHGFDYVALKIDLLEELESILKKRVDIVEYDLVRPELKDSILPSQIQIL